MQTNANNPLFSTYLLPESEDLEALEVVKVLPSLGAFTGGLNVLDAAITALFRDGAMVFAANGTRVHHIEQKRLRPDRFGL